MVFLEWLKQQRHHEDHYSHSKYVAVSDSVTSRHIRHVTHNWCSWTGPSPFVTGPHYHSHMIQIRAGLITVCKPHQARPSISTCPRSLL